MSANLGKIAITIGGDHVISNTYERLTIVKSATDVWYLSLWDVPANIALTDQGYWVVFFDPAMNSQQVADNAQSIVGILQTLDTKSDVGHTHDYAPLSEIQAHLNVLQSQSTLPSSFDASSITTSNKDHVNLLTHVGTPNNAYWHVHTQWYSNTKNCSQVATTYNQSPAAMYVRSRYNDVWTPWTLATGAVRTQKRGILGNSRTHYIFPPSGFTMSHLTACSVGIAQLHMNSSAVDATCYVYYDTDRITITTHAYVYNLNYQTTWEKI